MSLNIRKEIFYHILFWVVYMSIFTFVEGGYNNQFRQAFLIELIFLPFRLSVIYLNYFWLMPAFLLQKRFVAYILYSVVSILIASFLHRLLMYESLNAILYPDWDQGSFWQAYRFLQSAMIITSPMIFLIGMTVMTRWASTERRAELLEKEKLKAELGYLRSQINPHFFFNTLNNLYGLALLKSEKTAEVVMKLSELMSYILYEADRETVPLVKEIDQIERYVALEQIRYDNRFEVHFQTEGDVDHFEIPPLLLLPFVENSFKHGVNKSSQDGWISIFISIDNHVFTFIIKNKVAALQTEKSGNNGLGIVNVQKRLDLIFPNCHTLECKKTADLFIVHLQIK